MENLSRRYVERKGINEGRIVLHSDLNNFFASVECQNHPELLGFPVAVCGRVDERHGIVLAKNELAKRCGVKTAEPIWQAKSKCAELLIVNPDYEEYERYSFLVKQIYSEYTDRVEGFGIDEAWLELTSDIRIKTLEDGKEIADEIRKRVRKKTGLTVSIGVSDNKIFSKLASDYKKPNAVTVFGPQNYESIIRNIDASELIFVGRSTKARLNELGIYTIGNIADTSEVFMKSMLGKNGESLFYNACGANDLKVSKTADVEKAKSIGNSATLPFDLDSKEKISDMIFALAEKVAYRLRCENCLAKTLCISVRDTTLRTTEKQMPIEATANSIEIAKAAIQLYIENYDVNVPVRSLGIRTTNLISIKDACQINIFDDKLFYREKLAKIDITIDKIREKYGANSISHLSAIKNNIHYHGATSFSRR